MEKFGEKIRTIECDDCFNLNIFGQSICTHYSSLSGRPNIFLGSGTLKKGPKYGLQKAGCNPYFGPFFTGSQTEPCFQNKNSGCRLSVRLNKMTFNNYDDTILPSFTTYLHLGEHFSPWSWTKLGIFDHLPTSSCPSSHWTSLNKNGGKCLFFEYYCINRKFNAKFIPKSNFHLS